VDVADRRAPVSSDLRAFTRACLERRAAPGLARALGVAAARELLEETGLALGRLDEGRLLPDLGALDYLCRAVTPAAMPIRFNARFLVAPSEAAAGAVRGSGELERLRFFTLEEASGHKLAAITGKILAEFRDWLAMSPAERKARELVCFRGMDDRLPEL
jgi:8-oxo-dGTP pyrophosphatase MutT (NUDIX family)